MIAFVPPEDSLALAPEVAAAAAEIHRTWSARERRRRSVWIEYQPWTVPQISLASVHPHEAKTQSESS